LSQSEVEPEAPIIQKSQETRSTEKFFETSAIDTFFETRAVDTEKQDKHMEKQNKILELMEKTMMKGIQDKIDSDSDLDSNKGIKGIFQSRIRTIERRLAASYFSQRISSQTLDVGIAPVHVRVHLAQCGGTCSGSDQDQNSIHRIVVVRCPKSCGRCCCDGVSSVSGLDGTRPPALQVNGDDFTSNEAYETMEPIGPALGTPPLHSEQEPVPPIGAPSSGTSETMALGSTFVGTNPQIRTTPSWCRSFLQFPGSSNVKEESNTTRTNDAKSHDMGLW
jgi:hypothetical protein